MVILLIKKTKNRYIFKCVRFDGYNYLLKVLLCRSMVVV